MFPFSSRARTGAGFSTVELVVVMGIMGVMMTILVGGMAQQTRSMSSQLASLMTAPQVLSQLRSVISSSPSACAQAFKKNEQGAPVPVQVIKDSQGTPQDTPIDRVVLPGRPEFGPFPQKFSEGGAPIQIQGVVIRFKQRLIPNVYMAEVAVDYRPMGFLGGPIKSATEALTVAMNPKGNLTACNLVAQASELPTDFCYAVRKVQLAQPTCDRGYYLKAIYTGKSGSQEGLGAVCCYSRPGLDLDLTPGKILELSARMEGQGRLIPRSVGKSYNDLVADCEASRSESDLSQSYALHSGSRSESWSCPSPDVK
jgi:type II secretory pathway pseudopilin PulG